MLFDCVIIGGGPAGLNAALVLGRARRNVLLFDNNSPRNAVTHESHGFITRDGISPSEFRKIAHQDIAKYASVQWKQQKIVNISKESNGSFQLVNEIGEKFQSRKIILATGLKENLPSVNGILDYYGKSLFSCPYCDGWELKDKPLMVISENEHVFHMAKTVYNWSKDLIVCTNGKPILTIEQKDILHSKNIQVYEQIITALDGSNGMIEKIVFEGGTAVNRSGGFITPQWIQASAFGEALDCELNPMGGIITDSFGRTNIAGVFAAGDTSVIAPSQLIIAAAEGSRAAIGVNTDLTQAEF
jgi:thioredoxin reductase